MFTLFRFGLVLRGKIAEPGANFFIFRRVQNVFGASGEKFIDILLRLLNSVPGKRVRAKELRNAAGLFAFSRFHALEHVYDGGGVVAAFP